MSGVDDLIARLKHGVPVLGLHDDNSTELFDIEEANERMHEAADSLASAQAEIAALRAELAAAREALAIGDKVRVIGEHEADWAGIDTWLTGISIDHQGLDYMIGEQWPVPHRHMSGYLGMTDGFREGEIVRALKVHP